jgi:hypothetical protein
LFWQTSRGKIKTMEYKPYPRRPKMPDQEADREPLLFQLWKLLDSKVYIILAEPVGVGDIALQAEMRKVAQNQARGLAEGIAIIMYPFMADSNAVVKAAIERHKGRQAGVQVETPGLGEHMWDPNFNHDGSPRVQVARPRTERTAIKAPPKPPEKQLSDTEKETIRHMLKTKMMGPEELAKMFGVSVTTIVKLG